MSKAKRNALVIAGVCIVLGVVLCCAAYISAGGDVRNFNAGTEADLVERTYTTAAPLTSLTLSDSNHRVIVKPSPDNQVHVSYFENDYQWYEIDEQDGALRFVHHRKQAWSLFMFNVQLTTPQVEILLPADMAPALRLETGNSTIALEGVATGGIYAKTSNGRVTLIDIDSTGDIELHTSNERMTLDRVRLSGSLTAHSSNGRVSLKSVQAAAAALETGNGAIIVDESTVSGALQARTSNNSIDIDAVRAASLTLRSSNGAIDLSSVDAAGALEAVTNNGAIRLDYVSAGERLKLQTSNNAITGVIQGAAADFTIYSKTSNADNNLPDGFGNGAKELSVTTSNGRIAVEFSE